MRMQMRWKARRRWGWTAVAERSRFKSEAEVYCSTVQYSNMDRGTQDIEECSGG